eukprot:TRINITY_DN41942_c0_g1_i1.p2 TRINITY_DN41942_c0_g1~~TRINITY_DN41942_c0_g1_i1.p2  ORF type:complete len:125 (-),score=30.00 TRINITY_DN41942_c0_g1_i1:88-462(-)
MEAQALLLDTEMSKTYALLDKMAITVFVASALIMASKPIHPKVKWGAEFLPQMALHMWSFAIVALIIFNSGTNPEIDQKFALLSFVGAMSVITNCVTLDIPLNIWVAGVTIVWELCYVVERFAH